MGGLKWAVLRDGVLFYIEKCAENVTLHVKNHILKVFDFVDRSVFKHFCFMIVDDIVILKNITFNFFNT